MIQCKDPFELLEYVSPIRYGIINTSNNKIIEYPPDLNFHSEAPVTLPDKTFENGYGTCWEVSIIFYQQLLHMPNVDNIQCIYLERGKYGTDFFHNHFAIAFQYKGKQYSIENFGGAQGGLRGPYSDRNTVIDILYHANDYSPERKWTFINSDYPIEKLIDSSNALNVVYAKDVINLSNSPSSVKTKTNSEVNTTKLNKFIGKETLGKVNINQEQFLKYLDDNDMPLDEIFDEINNLTGVNNTKKSNKILIENNQNQQTQQNSDQAPNINKSAEDFKREIAEAKANYDRIVAKAKETSKKRKLTPEELEEIRKAEIELNKKILAEAKAIERDMQNPEVLERISNNPREYARQHPTSIGSVPKQCREELAPEKSILESGGSAVLGAGITGIGLIRNSVMMQLTQSVLATPVAIVMSLITGAWALFTGFFVKMVTGNYGKNVEVNLKQTEYKYKTTDANNKVTYKTIHREQLVDRYGNVMSDVYVDSDSNTIDALAVDKNSVDATKKIKDKITTLSKDRNANLFQQTIQKQDSSGNLIYEKLPETYNDSGNTKGITTRGWAPFSWLGDGNNFAKWGLFAVIIATIAYFLYKYINRRNRKAREEQLKKIRAAQQGQSNKISTNESMDITTEMLCEYFPEDNNYFKECEAFDEWVNKCDKELELLQENVFTNMFNKNKNPYADQANRYNKIKNRVYKGIKTSAPLADGVVIGSDLNIISPLLARFSRVIIGMGNIVYPTTYAAAEKNLISYNNYLNKNNSKVTNV